MQKIWNERLAIDEMIWPGVTELIGSSGSGKTQACRVLLRAGLREGRRCFLIATARQLRRYTGDIGVDPENERQVIIHSVPDFGKGETETAAALRTAISQVVSAAAPGDLIILDDMICDIPNYAEFDALSGTDWKKPEDGKFTFIVLAGHEATARAGSHSMFLMRQACEKCLLPEAAREAAASLNDTQLRSLDDGEGYMRVSVMSPLPIKVEMAAS